jgi:hypothetical protein
MTAIELKAGLVAIVSREMPLPRAGQFRALQLRHLIDQLGTELLQRFSGLRPVP